MTSVATESAEANWLVLVGLYVIGMWVLGGGLAWAWNAWQQKREPCVHGTTGGNARPSLCARCKADAERYHQEKLACEAREAVKREARRRKAYREYVRQIRLPQYLASMNPREFEALVCDLFGRLGYSVEVTPYVGDGGVDAFLRKEGGLAILQAKRVKGSVGEPVLRDLFGTMHAHSANQGIVVTTGNVSKAAARWASGKAIRIICLDELARLIRDRFSEDDVVPNSFRADMSEEIVCPRCGSPLRKVSGRRGPFLGCSAYPRCSYTRSGAMRRRG